mmetsp:Transcript_31666/g.43206  ORF Transcript_31666/g.43206 Transcript_31666/m.43206 type:complete len:206 (-) Transcript_31666:1027-1644(-)
MYLTTFVRLANSYLLISRLRNDFISISVMSSTVPNKTPLFRADGFWESVYLRSLTSMHTAECCRCGRCTFASEESLTANVKQIVPAPTEEGTLMAAEGPLTVSSCFCDCCCCFISAGHSTEPKQRMDRRMSITASSASTALTRVSTSVSARTAESTSSARSSTRNSIASAAATKYMLSYPLLLLLLLLFWLWLCGIVLRSNSSAT